MCYSQRVAIPSEESVKRVVNVFGHYGTQITIFYVFQ
jgi:hypothetical protein